MSPGEFQEQQNNEWICCSALKGACNQLFRPSYCHRKKIHALYLHSTPLVSPSNDQAPRQLSCFRYLSVEQAEAGAKPDLRKYARVAWTFLNTAGYINFGVAPDIAAKALETPATRGTVIIVGAGLAGTSKASAFPDILIKVCF